MNDSLPLHARRVAIKHPTSASFALASLALAACVSCSAPAPPAARAATPASATPAAPAPAAPATPTAAAPADTHADAATPSRFAPVFDCSHVNFAWGFSMSGRFIDADGSTYTYSRRQPAWLPKVIDDNGAHYLSDADLQAKLAGATRTGSVEAAALATQRQAIAAAAGGAVTKTDGGARDAGSSSCHAYVQDAANARWRDVELGSDGGVTDLRLHNAAPEAQAMLVWLKSVGVAQ